jgi:2-phospho-L-lactate transferase/gluconeogenesis factor (CofD/UPF0052 family)
MNPRAQEAIEQATHIIVAPGHTYGTILPTLALPALGRAIQGSRGKLMTVMTLLTTPRQTSGWSGEDFVRVYESYLGRSIEAVIANTGVADVELVDGQEWVRFTEDRHSYDLIREDVVSWEKQGQSDGDVVPRGINRG